MDNTNEQLYTTREVAQVLRVCTRTIAIWRKGGKITATRVGRKWLFKRSEIRRLMDV